VNTILVSIILGIVEGLTEFLPVSSTAHLRVVEPWLGVDLGSGYWKMYTVVIQLGAILSVVWLFWKRGIQLLRSMPRDKGFVALLWHPIGMIALAFLVTAGPCYLADKTIGKNLENLTVIGLALLLGGIIMWVVDAVYGSSNRATTDRLEHMSPLQAVWIGAVQILSAVFPGTSRSMSTIAAGQTAGLTRSVAVEFSFFLSIPTMFAASGFKLLQAIVKRPRTGAEIAAFGAPPQQWLVLAIGFFVSFVVALAVNAWFISWVRRRGFAVFAIYRIVLGIAVLIWAHRLAGGTT
jgi:undecaprenyl-diphosphatase